MTANNIHGLLVSLLDAAEAGQVTTAQTNHMALVGNVVLLAAADAGHAHAEACARSWNGATLAIHHRHTGTASLQVDRDAYLTLRAAGQTLGRWLATQPADRITHAYHQALGLSALH